MELSAQRDEGGRVQGVSEVGARQGQADRRWRRSESPLPRSPPKKVGSVRQGPTRMRTTAIAPPFPARTICLVSKVGLPTGEGMPRTGDRRSRLVGRYAASAGAPPYAPGANRRLASDADQVSAPRPRDASSSFFFLPRPGSLTLSASAFLGEARAWRRTSGGNLKSRSSSSGSVRLGISLPPMRV
jgi:hypothetical protein